MVESVVSRQEVLGGDGRTGYKVVSDLERMNLRSDVLFTYDERGRMVCENDPERRPAPRLYLAYTADGYVIRLGQGVPDAIAAQLQNMLDHEPPLEHVQAVPPVVRRIEDALEQQVSAQKGGPAYRFPTSLPPASEAIQIVASNVEVARVTYPWLLTELAEWWPCFAVVCDGVAVSVCFSARNGAVVCEAGVETLPAFRRRGYAGAVTAAWAAAIFNLGRVPLYSTSWGNVASQGLAGRLGLIQE